ncbi:hypothetical protein NDU88_004692 [Pleurodeles waltl]|uniref:Uncharacterized protein n=1 Tax=Pleurodeles waltl TaxID=8319 RepID=A0AAV7L9D8_PLEWA|nr:hypothetical protein NDU88_004692 [Pleurodeles waltl]
MGHCIREARPCDNDVGQKNLGPPDPYPWGTVKRVTSVRVEKQTDVWMHKEEKDGKWWGEKGRGKDWWKKGTETTQVLRVQTANRAARRVWPETRGKKRKKSETQGEGTEEAGQEKTTDQEYPGGMLRTTMYLEGCDCHRYTIAYTISFRVGHRGEGRA